VLAGSWFLGALLFSSATYRYFILDDMKIWEPPLTSDGPGFLISVFIRFSFPTE
jgi:hypothetical protein